MTWRNESSSIQSKGSAYKKLGLVKSLADLHEARSVHDSQFFTPAKIVDFIWSIINPLCDGLDSGRIVPIMDNSIGSGALLEHADPKKHQIFGCDVDAGCIEALNNDLAAAEFSYELRHSSIAEVRFQGMGISVLNPPFSIHLASPALESDFPSTCFGKYGPNTHAISHDYALDQALDAAQCVIGVLPSNYAHSIKNKRLVAIIDLPADTFQEEAANVKTSVVVFNGFDVEFAPLVCSFGDLVLSDLISRITPLCPSAFRPRIRHFQRKAGGKSIHTPVTGDKSVRVYRSGDWVKLAFNCGFVEAKVLNGLYRRYVDRSVPHRIPVNFEYEGQGQLYLPFFFTKEDPVSLVDDLASTINGLGGEAQICSQLVGYVRKRAKKYQMQMSGYARWIQSQDLLNDRGECSKTFVANPRVFPSPVIKKGEILDLITMDGAEWLIGREDGSKVICMRERVQENVKIEKGGAEWKRIGSSMAERYPEKAKVVQERCEALGVFKDSCSWDYQREDVVETLLSPLGCLSVQQQGLGKTRLAYGAAVGTLSGRSVIITLPSLLDQFIEEAANIGVTVNVIDSPEGIQTLGRINLITTSRLRCIVPGTKRTYAKTLRNRFGTVILDEADLLRNARTQQTRAIMQLGGVRKIGLSGTPIANYPRNLVPLASWVFGEGNIVQPYSEKKAFPETVGLQNCTYTRRGIDVFSEEFVIMEWATNAFRDSLQDGSGAKREIPGIRNLSAYREYASRLMIRRLRDEPMVSKYFPTIDIKEKVHTIDWDNSHLAHYITVADDFKRWFAKVKGESKNLSLVVLLARIGAVIAACNNPQFPTKNSKGFYGNNAKVAATLDLVEQDAEQGRKSIVFLSSPKQAAFLADQADARGIKNILLSGEINQRDRTTSLRDDFRNGAASVCFATFGVARYGLNIPEAEMVYFYDRCWSHTEENQAIFRVLRPQQTKDVCINYMHLDQSIDEYMAQLVEFKKDAANAGLDYAEPTADTGNFLHMDHIFSQFCSDMADRFGVNTRGELRDMLKAS